MERLVQDLRFAARLLWKDRSFTLTTVLTLALCLAANIAIFAIVHSVLLRPLPFPEPERLVTVFNSYPGAGVVRASSGVPDYYDRLRDVAAFEALAMYRTTGVTIGGQQQGEVERVTSMPSTPSFFRLLEVRPLRGQLFTEQEAEPGNDRKVVLSHGLWQRKFAGRDDAVGQDLRIGGVPHTIVGVLPQGFAFVNPEVQLWTPVAFTAEQRSDDQRHSNNWQQIARLRAGATIQQAQSQIDAINARNLDAFPAMKTALINAGFATRVVGTEEDLVREARRTLFLLWGGALLVLAIGCVNVANLVSIRATSRIRELATRAAMGASVARLSRQLLTETVLLASLGGTLGLLLGWWVLRSATTIGFERLPRGSEITLDPVSVAVSIALVGVTGLMVGVLPIVMLRRTNLAQVIREEGRSGTASRGARTVRRMLVTSQVAFALILLVGAGLLLASFQRVLAVDPGFDADQLLTGSVSLPATQYADENVVRAAVERLLERVRALPGVEAAGVTTSLPFGGSYSDGVIMAEGYQMAPGESLISPSRIVASEGYFEAMRIGLREGRYFDARDRQTAPRSVIVDERLARKFWPGQSPVGRRMYSPTTGDFTKPPERDDQYFQVIGVVDEVRLIGLVDSSDITRSGAYYFSYAALPARSVTLALRTTVDPTTLTNAIRRELAQIDAELPFYGVRTMEERVSQSVVDRRTPLWLALGFAIVALFLAAIGIYGVLAYQVSQRAREIGIRLALGAAASSIFRMVLSEGALMVVTGAVLGLVGAFLLRRTLQAQLYEVGAMDPLVLAGVAGILALVAFVACVLPARRAAKTNPVVALME
ncbi:MAG: ABC transporter permease [Vicinamibacterales bacterium]